MEWLSSLERAEMYSISGEIPAVLACLLPFVLFVLGLLFPALSAAQSNAQPFIGAACSDSTSSPELLAAPELDLHDVEGQIAEEHYTHGLRLSSEGDAGGAEKEFRAALAEAPRNAAFVRQLGVFYIGEKRYNDAIGVIRDYTRLCGVTAVGYALEGELPFQQKQFDAAYLAVVASLRLSDNTARMHELLGLIYAAQEKDALSIPELEKALQLDGDDADIRYFYGRALYINGRYIQARDQFIACLKIQSRYRKALENLGLCYEVLGEYHEASQAFKKAIALERAQTGPKHGEPFGYYGAMLIKMNELEKARQILMEGVTASPRSFVVNYEMGKVLLTLGHLEEAGHYLLIAANLAPAYPRTYFLLGKVHEKQHRSADAARDLAKFAELNKGTERVGFPLTDRPGAQD